MDQKQILRAYLALVNKNIEIENLAANLQSEINLLTSHTKLVGKLGSRYVSKI